MFTEVFNAGGLFLGVIDILPKKLYKGKINHYGNIIDIEYVYEDDDKYISYYHENEKWFAWYKHLIIP